MWLLRYNGIIKGKGDERDRLSELGLLESFASGDEKCLRLRFAKSEEDARYIRGVTG